MREGGKIITKEKNNNPLRYWIDRKFKQHQHERTQKKH